MQSVFNAEYKSQKSRGASAILKPPVIVTEDGYRTTLEAIACIRTHIGKLSHVKKIAYSPQGQLLTVQTFVDDHTEKALRLIYKEELKISDMFPALLFHFTVIFDPRAEAPSNFITETCLP